MAIACFAVMAACQVPGWADASGSEVYDAYLRRAAPVDPGTAHLLILNTGVAPLRVASISLNGYKLADSPDDLAIWHRAAPRTVQPGRVTDVMAKLRRATSMPLRLSVRFTDGQETWAVVNPEPPLLVFTFIGFSSDGKSAYLYLRNRSARGLAVRDVLRNGVSVGSRCFVPNETIPPYSKALVILQAEPPFASGQYEAFKVLTDGGPATAVVRVHQGSPLATVGAGTTVWPEPGQDPLELPYASTAADFARLRGAARDRAYYVLDDPALRDSDAGGLLGANAGEVVRRVDECYENDPLHSTLVLAGEYMKPFSYLAYGEVADIVAVDPREMARYQSQPLRDADFVALAREACAPRPLWAVPEAFPNKHARRCLTPEEERIVVYSEIGEGSKGVWYHIGSDDTGDQLDAALRAEIDRISQELGALGEYLAIGDVFPLARTDSHRCVPYALLCGDRAIVILLLNESHYSYFGSSGVPFMYEWQDDVVLRVAVPEWLEAVRVVDVSGSEQGDLPYYRGADGLIIRVERLDVSKQILILTRRSAASPHGAAARLVPRQGRAHQASPDTKAGMAPAGGQAEDLLVAVTDELAGDWPGIGEWRMSRAWSEILAYGREAAYAEQYRCLARQTLAWCGGDAERAGQFLLDIAGAAMQRHEPTAALCLYRATAAEYPQTRSARRALLSIGALLGNEGDRKGAIAEYRRLVEAFPHSKEAELVPLELVKVGIDPQEVLR